MWQQLQEQKGSNTSDKKPLRWSENQKGVLMMYPLTDNDNDRLEEKFDSITTNNSLPLDIAPPSESNSFRPSTPEAFNASDYSLAKPSRHTEIPDEVHEALLRQSLEEYGDLWRSLARR
jgi:hypothetical protein